MMIGNSIKSNQIKWRNNNKKIVVRVFVVVIIIIVIIIGKCKRKERKRKRERLTLTGISFASCLNFAKRTQPLAGELYDSLKDLKLEVMGLSRLGRQLMAFCCCCCCDFCCSPELKWMNNRQIVFHFSKRIGIRLDRTGPSYLSVWLKRLAI